MITVNVLEHGVCSEDNRENVLYLRKLLDEYRDQGEVEILFPGGTYHFYPDYAVEKLLYISNHDEDTIKKIAFDLTGYKDAKIRGEEAVFIFHTDIIPFTFTSVKGLLSAGSRSIMQDLHIQKEQSAACQLITWNLRLIKRNTHMW